jgi:hypothetical protein
MAELVQDTGGITTGVQFRPWIEPVVGEHSRPEQPDELLRTQRVVPVDGTIGDGAELVGAGLYDRGKTKKVASRRAKAARDQATRR